MTDEKHMFDADEPLAGNVEKAVALVDTIEKVFEETGEHEAAVEENEFEFPLKTAVELLPVRYLRNVDDDDISGRTIVLKVDDIFEQLRDGYVKLAVSDLVYFIPMHLVYRAACDDSSVVWLPLQTVVGCVGLDKLKRHTPAVPRQYEIDRIEDPFTQRLPEDSAYVLESESPVKLEDDEAEPDTEKQEIDDSVEPESGVFSEVAADHELYDTDQTSTEKTSDSEEGSDTSMETLVAEVFSDNELAYPAAAILALLPQPFADALGAKADGDAFVKIEVPSLYDSLRQGRVRAPVKNVISALSPEQLAGDVPSDMPEEIELDVSMVVESVGLDIFTRLTPVRLKNWDIDRLEDPFEAPEILPKLQRAPKEERVAEKIKDSSSIDGVEVKVLPYISTQGDEIGLEFRELPGNININKASMEELMILDGVDAALAESIVKRREQKGVFKNIFELLEVPGLDNAGFRKMTGMKAEGKRYHRRKRLAGLLKIPASDVANLSFIARALARKSGFTGCVISDSDGLILAENGTEQYGDDLSAVVPRMFRQIQHNMGLIGVDNIQTVTMAVETLLYTISVCENVCLIAVHDQSRVSETELVFIRKVARELSWLLSRRAYVGPA